MHPIPDIRPSGATNRRIPKTTPLSSRSSSIGAGSWVAYIEMGVRGKPSEKFDRHTK